ncbi:MAG: alpha/beta fold hydrolase [Ktedonobacteraceae bacterium]
MSIKIASTNDIKINVQDIGSGKPVVFLHGWPVNSNMFEYQYNELPKHGYRCIGIDLRGYGESDKPWEGYNYDTLSDDVRAVIEALNLHDVTLLGFSMGGAIAIHYMSRHQGARVSRLALMGAAAPAFTQREDFPYGLPKSGVDSLIAGTYADRPAMLKAFSQNFFYAPDKLSPEFQIWNLSLGLAASSHATIQCAIELRDADLRRDLASINVPTAILHGINDKVCLFDLARAMHEGIEGSELIAFENAGHGFYYEQRDKVNAELLRFLGFQG